MHHPVVSVTLEDAAKRVRHLGITREDIEAAVRQDGGLSPIVMANQPLRLWISDLDEWAAAWTS